MGNRVSGRLGALVVTGAVAAAVAATIAFAGSSGGAAQEASAGSMQMSLNGGPPFTIRSYDFEVKADSSWQRGAGSSISRPVAGEFVFTKGVDATFDGALTNLARGTTFAKGELNVSWGAGEKVTYLMSGMLVTSVAQAATGGRPIDTIKLRYKTISWKLGPATGSWDVSQGTVK